MEYKPINGKILVKPDEHIGMIGMIHIPEPRTTRQKKTTRGTVVNLPVGTNGDCSVKIGDHILFNQWTGESVVLDGERLLLMDEEEILGVLED